MHNIENIKDKALNIGACDKIGKVSDYKSLVNLFFSPQGREFCEQHNYPSLAMFREISNKVKPYRVFVDADRIEVYNEPYIALVGDTHAKIKIHGVDCLYHIVLMHGATAEIEVSHYAVVQIMNISGGEVAIHNDKTTKVHYEHQFNRSHRQ
jgi:hypothetical protein